MKISIEQSSGLAERVETFGGPVQFMCVEAPEITFEIEGCSVVEAREILFRLQGLPGVPVIDENTDTVGILKALDPHFARRLDIE